MTELREARTKIRSEMRAAAAAVRNEKRKKSRLMNKAKQVPTNDLLEIARQRFLDADKKAAKTGQKTGETSENPSE